MAMPALDLTPYQARWLADRSQLKLLTKSRGIGGSFVVTLDHMLSACGFGVDQYGREYYVPSMGNDVFLVSASMEQSVELLLACVEHLDAISTGLEQSVFEGEPGVEKVRLRNGHKIMAMPANPRTVRSFRGDVILDELGVMPHGKEMWAAALPITRATMRRPRGHRLSALGTAFGDDNILYRLAMTDDGKMLSRHTVTIHDAAAEGFPVDVEQLRAEVGDPDAFAQEYECQFLSAASRYISAEAYDACVYYPDDADDTIPRQGHRTSYAGMDVGRKSDGDPSVITTLMRIGDTNWHCSTESRRGAGWQDQEAWVAETLGTSQRIAIDVTGMGNQFGERLVSRFGPRIDPVIFTVKTKEMLATGLKLAIERKKIRIRADDVELRRDVLALRRNMTSHGNVTFEAAHTKDGHADRAWALALAVHTASGPDSSNVKVNVVGERTTNQLNKSW